MDILFNAPDYEKSEVIFGDPSYFGSSPSVFRNIQYTPSKSGFILSQIENARHGIVVNNSVRCVITGNYASCIFIPISKGDTIEFTGAHYAIFIPCKER